jgi:hypothetical protein
VQREEALKRLARLYGFSSARATLRYLITVPEEIREAALAEGAITQKTTAFLPSYRLYLGSSQNRYMDILRMFRAITAVR